MFGSSCSHSTAARGQSTSLKRNSLCWGHHQFAQLAYGTLKLRCCCRRSPVLLQKQILWQGATAKGIASLFPISWSLFHLVLRYLCSPGSRTSFIHSFPLIFLSPTAADPALPAAVRTGMPVQPQVCMQLCLQPHAASLCCPQSRAKTSASFPLVTLRANYPVKQ